VKHLPPRQRNSGSPSNVSGASSSVMARRRVGSRTKHHVLCHWCMWSARSSAGCVRTGQTGDPCATTACQHRSGMPRPSTSLPFLDRTRHIIDPAFTMTAITLCPEMDAARSRILVEHGCGRHGTGDNPRTR
jgi:hypothetical protein